jgi:hypothetical protein
VALIAVYVPGSQALHSLAATALLLSPTAHSAQKDAPGSFANRPIGHEIHGSPVTLLKVPALHESQMTRPVDRLNLPNAQGSQSDLPAAGCRVLIGQLTHDVALLKAMN